MTQPVVVARDLSRHYEVRSGPFTKPHVIRALSDASFSLLPGKTLAVVGESGCGKSTLARLITMIEPPTSGEFESGRRTRHAGQMGQAAHRCADRVPGSLRLTEPAPAGRRDP